MNLANYNTFQAKAVSQWDKRQYQRLAKFLHDKAPTMNDHKLQLCFHDWLQVIDSYTRPGQLLRSVLRDAGMSIWMPSHI